MFLKIWVYFQAYKNCYPPRNEKYLKFEKKKNWFQKKKICSDTDTEIEP